MNITLTITTENPDEIARVLHALGGDMPELAHQPMPGTMTKTVIVTPDEVAAQAQTKVGLTVDELKAGMTLKPTATSSLNDGSKVAIGDYVMVGANKKLIEATYRGTLIVVDEDGAADVVKTEDCAAVPAEARGPRLGTAAALLGEQHPAAAAPAEAPASADTDPVSAEVAAQLRERATTLIVSEKASVEEVMGEIARVHPGANVIEQMTGAEAATFRQWLEAKEQGKNPAFGF
jgi:hypothetical protein